MPALRLNRALFALISLLVSVSFAGASGTRPVLAHYMPWFVARPYSSSWGWHWTMNHYDPDIVGPDGRRPIASKYYPLIGPYDSADPVVLEYHVLLMKLAGIDGVIVDWYGMDNYNDYAVNNQRTAALLKYTQKAGLRFALCYEDSTIQHEVEGKFVAPETVIVHAQQTMLYVETNYFNAPGYLRRNDQPVLLNFGPQYFKRSSDWQAIFLVLQVSNRPAFFTEDDRLAIGAGAFNWPPMQMSQTNGGVLCAAQLQTYLACFEQKARAWPACVSSSFPRFHDIYQQAGVGASYGYLDDRSGDTLRETLGRALTNAAALVQVVTWNDFGEGTTVEPTREFGYRDLGILQDFRRQYLDSTFAWHTNDLFLPRRVYDLRRSCANNAEISGELDRVFTNIISGRLTQANRQLTDLESSLPRIMDLPKRIRPALDSGANAP